MSNTVTLPNELIEQIISTLSVTDDKSTVQACALASKSWLARLRPVLFDTVVISPVNMSPDEIRPLSIPRQSMALSYARHISITTKRSIQAVTILKTLCAIAPHLSERFHSLELLLIHINMQGWEREPVSSMIKKPNFHLLRDRVTSLSLQTVSVERGFGALLLSAFPQATSLTLQTSWVARNLGALLLSAFPHVTSFQFYGYPYTRRYSYPRTAPPPVFLSPMRLYHLSWTQGPIMEISDSLRSPPIVNILQHLDIVFSDSLEQWRTIESLLSQINALVDLRITMQQHKPTPGLAIPMGAMFTANMEMAALRQCEIRISLMGKPFSAKHQSALSSFTFVKHSEVRKIYIVLLAAAGRL